MSGLLRDTWFQRIALGLYRKHDRERRAREAGVTLEELDAADEAARTLRWMKEPGARATPYGFSFMIEAVDLASGAFLKMSDVMAKLAEVLGVPPVPEVRLSRADLPFDRSLAVGRSLPPRPPRGWERERRPRHLRRPPRACGRGR